MATEWFYYSGDQRIGPVRSQQLKDLARKGQLHPDSLIWKEGMAKPQPASRLEGLFRPSVSLGEARGSTNGIEPMSTPQRSVGFFSYLPGHFSATHGLWVWWALIAILSAPLLSLAKPVLGISGLSFIVLSTVIAGFAFGFLYFVQRLGAYYFRGERDIGADARSWLARLTYGSFVMFAPFALVLGVEFFSSPLGVMATLVPKMQNVQKSILTNVLGRFDSSVEADASVNNHQPVPSPASLDTASEEASDGRSGLPLRATSDPLPSSREQTLASPTPDSGTPFGPESPKAPNAQPTPEQEPAAPVAAHAGAKSQSGGSMEDKPASALATQSVVAEGVGATSDEALKDAFRNAVRQVVGAVVDADTLIENDEVIEDKVLTYSGGLIKKYEEIPGSKTQTAGLHHIKIKAQVERRGVIAKLKAANITEHEVDGNGLFSEVVTQLDAEKDAAAILQKEFEDFPQSCITARIVGEPKIKEKSADNATVAITVQILPDLMAYKVFAGRILPILRTIASIKGEFTVKYAEPWFHASGVLGSINRNGAVSGEDESKTWVPRLFDDAGNWKKGQVSLAIAKTRTKAADRIDYEYFAFDSSLEPVLKAVAFRTGQCKLQLVDADGGTVATDRFEPLERSQVKLFYGSLIAASGEDGYGQTVVMTKQADHGGDPNAKLKLLQVSPVFGDLRWHKNEVTITRTISLSLDELKSVKDAKVEISFDE